MKKYIRPPYLSTSFSGNGEQAKRRFENILDGRGKKRGIIAFILVICAMLIFGGCFVKDSNMVFDDDGIVNVAVFCTDVSQKRSDVILLCRLNDEMLHITQIPRDTFVGLTGGDKIGHMETPELTKLAIYEAVGVQCDNYMKLNFEGFRKIVDAVGGVDFDVPMDMVYSDPAQDLEINLKKGKQHLNGDQLEMMLRWKMGNLNDDGTHTGYENGDIDRLALQSMVYCAFAEQIIENGVSKELPKIIAKNAETNLSVSDITEIAAKAMKLNKENIAVGTLAGKYMENGEYIPDSVKQAKYPGESISSEDDTIGFRTTLKSARINGKNFEFSDEGGYLTMYNERLNKAVIIFGSPASRGKETIYGSGSVSIGDDGSTGEFLIKHGIWGFERLETDMELTVNASVSGDFEVGSELVITCTDSDTYIVVGLEAWSGSLPGAKRD